MAPKKQILIVDDERDLVELLGYNLKKAGYDIVTAFNGRAALEAISQRLPDLVLLDIMLPELSGTEVASRIRSNVQTAGIPIIMLTAKGEEIDQLVGLTVGADDYVCKPFSVKVLLARIEAVLRRMGRQGSQEGTLLMGGLRINMETHEAFVNNEPVKLTLTEFRLLAALVHAGGRVLNRQMLMARAMGPGVTVTERTIDVHMTAIRKKLTDCSNLIKTVRGVGYRATAEDTADDESTAVTP